MGSVTISVKVPAELKEKVDKYRIKVSETLRQALEREVQRREDEDMKTMLGKISAQLKGRLTAEEIVTAVRETREER
jgi:antitoxin CcdA